MTTFGRVRYCRACASTALTQIFNLGTLFLTGVFPAPEDEAPKAPLSLCYCGHCGLVQLEHTYDEAAFFERGYGYLSGINASMRDHLESVAQDLAERFPLPPGATVIDIGANDGTFLQALPEDARKIAVDPGMAQFSESYHLVRSSYLALCQGYFPAVDLPCDPGQAKLISSIAVFYDVQDPLGFMDRVRNLLAIDGIWYCEQQYVGTLIGDQNFDAICHEHAAYYGVRQLYELSKRAGLKMIDVSFNPTNGGTIATIFARADSKLQEAKELDFLLAREGRICSEQALTSFSSLCLRKVKKIHSVISELTSTKSVFGLGASTKGNVLLQICRLSWQIKAIGEVNESKFGKLTPGTRIPIIPQDELLRMKPDYILILPWHFRLGFVQKLEAFTGSGGKLIFPLPTFEIYP